MCIRDRHFSAISEAGKARGEQARFFSQIWSAFLAVMFLAGSVIIAFSQWEIRLLSDPSYHEAWRYIPMLSAAMIFSAFVTFMAVSYTHLPSGGFAVSSVYRISAQPERDQLY